MMVVDAGRMMKLFKYEAKIFVGQKQQQKKWREANSNINCLS